MGNDLMAYIQKLELFGFFSGYCLIYTIISSSKSVNNGKRHTLIQKLFILLPYAYALTATLYLGMIIKNISLNYSSANLNEQFHVPFLQMLALFCGPFLGSIFQQKKSFEFAAQPCILFLYVERYFYSIEFTTRKRGHSNRHESLYRQHFAQYPYTS